MIKILIKFLIAQSKKGIRFVIRLFSSNVFPSETKNIEIFTETDANISLLSNMLSKDNAMSKIGLLIKAKVSHRNGYITIKENILLPKQSLKYYAKSIYSFQYMLPIKYPKRKIHLVNAFIVTSPSYKNYWHWHFDILMNLYIIDELEIEVKNIIINQPVFEYQYESLVFFQKYYDFYFVDNKSSFEVQNALIYKTNNNNIKEYLIELYKKINFINKKVSLIQTKKYKKIYITRDNPKSKRNVINFNEVELILKKCGFVIIRLEDYTYREQIVFFKGAEIIVGPHGAGFTNIIFCVKKTILIEFMHIKRDSSIFKNICKVKGITYYKLYSNNTDKSDDPNLLIDTIKFEKTLKKL